MGADSSLDLGSYTFNSFVGNSHSFGTVRNTAQDPNNYYLLWRLQYGEGEVSIKVTTSADIQPLVVFYFSGANTKYTFKYNTYSRIMDTSQANGMSFFSFGTKNHITFTFKQSKELTPLGTSGLFWTIIADWENIEIGIPVAVSVTVEPYIETTKLPVVR